MLVSLFFTNYSNIFLSRQSSTDYGDLIGEESTPVETGSITPPRPTGYVPYKPPTANTLSNAIASGSGIKSEVKVEPIQSTQAKVTRSDELIRA